MTDESLERLEYAVLVGGSGEDAGTAVGVDAAGRVVVAGSTTSTDFPAHPGSFAEDYSGRANDSFVMVFTWTRRVRGDPQ